MFGIHIILFLYNRGDTQSPINVKNNLHLRLDLRVVLDDHLEVLTGEFVSKKARNEVKRKGDLMKSLMSSKSSLNYILARVGDKKMDLSTIYLPFLQVCGLDLTLNVLSMDKPGSYLCQEVERLTYPTNFFEIRKGRLAGAYVYPS